MAYSEILKGDSAMNKERAASYLGQGVPPGQVASIMGCTPAYISQLMKDEEFVKLVKKHEGVVDGTEEGEGKSIQAKYTGLEHQLIKAMGDALPNAELPAITRALEVVANRQEKAAMRKNPAGMGTDSGRGVSVHVTLTLPTHAIPAQPVIQVNEKNEVVAIDDRSMAPMSSNGVEAMFRRKKAVDAIVKEL